MPPSFGAVLLLLGAFCSGFTDVVPALLGVELAAFDIALAALGVVPLLGVVPALLAVWVEACDSGVRYT